MENCINCGHPEEKHNPADHFHGNRRCSQWPCVCQEYTYTIPNILEELVESIENKIDEATEEKLQEFGL